MQVLKPFNTQNRRLRSGDPVDPGGDYSPHSLEHLAERGFIGEPEAKPPKSKSKPAAAEPDAA